MQLWKNYWSDRVHFFTYTSNKLPLLTGACCYNLKIRGVSKKLPIFTYSQKGIWKSSIARKAIESISNQNILKHLEIHNFIWNSLRTWSSAIHCRSSFLCHEYLKPTFGASWRILGYYCGSKVYGRILHAVLPYRLFFLLVCLLNRVFRIQFFLMSSSIHLINISVPQRSVFAPTLFLH